jgi:YidC/Oxa1 family membrane protein insertase
VLLPLTYRSIVSQVKMGIVNKLPEIQQINEKFKAEPQTLQRERMKFYGQVGVNPMSGCLPLLLQMPILIAMFMFFPNSIDLRQQPFLWATDLSTYDPFIDFGGRIPLIGTHLSLFCLLWVAAQLISAYITQRQQGVQPGQPKFMQYFPYIMPLLFFGIFNDYSSGLTWYYLCYTVLSLVQRQLVKMFLVDENNLRQQIHDYKEGKVARKRGGGLMGWMQRMQANREEMVQERNAQMQGRQGRRALENQRAKQQQRGGNPQPRKRK